MALAVGAVVVAGCTEERVVGVRGGLQNMPGAKGGVEVDQRRVSEGQSVGTSYDALLAKYEPYSDELVVDERHPLRLVDPDDPEQVTLVLRSPQHVLIHLFETLRNGEDDLLYEQVLSDRLKRNYRESLKDPREAVAYLKKNAREVRKLIASMPAADQTPGLYLKPLGDNAFRIEAPGGGALKMKFQTFDVVLEGGRFRLLLLH